MSIDQAREGRIKVVRNRIMTSVKAELSRGDIPAMDLLAVLAHTTGACIAMQDQRVVTPEMALDLVRKNLEAGNREAMTEVLSASGRAQ